MNRIIKKLNVGELLILKTVRAKKVEKRFVVENLRPIAAAILFCLPFGKKDNSEKWGRS